MPAARWPVPVYGEYGVSRHLLLPGVVVRHKEGLHPRPATRSPDHLQTVEGDPLKFGADPDPRISTSD